MVLYRKDINSIIQLFFENLTLKMPLRILLRIISVLLYVNQNQDMALRSNLVQLYDKNNDKS